MLTPRDYQLAGAELHYNNLKEHALTYIAWQERTGKSLTAVLTCEKANITSVLIITKNKAVPDWEALVANELFKKTYRVVTYGSVHKYVGNPDIVIIDEAHNYISGYPKPSPTWLKVRKLTKGKPLIFMSATPHAQGYQLLYHQLALSDWSPWAKYTSFYSWFKTYGIPRQIKVHGKWVNQYDQTNEELISATAAHLFDYRTRVELGFKYEPKDKLHYIALSEDTKELYNGMVKNKILLHNDRQILCDTTIKLRSALHMIEGGTVKQTVFGMDCTNAKNLIGDPVKLVSERIKDGVICHLYYSLPNSEKIDYILATWGDTTSLCIMYNYIAEEYKLRSVFKHANILQATSYAEGVDLAHIKTLVVYSQDFSTARHVQRRCRQASKNREEEIDVNFLLVKKAISEQVYETVAVNKTNFVDSTFRREII